MTIITLFTDASFCPNSRKGGWAMWAKRGSNEKIVFSKHFTRRIQDNNVAEMMAIANGLKVLYNKQWLDNNVLVVIGTDSQLCIDILENSNPKYGAMKVPYTVIRQIQQSCNIRLKMKHVKGHVNYYNRNARNHVNNTVDVLSHNAMKRARKMNTKRLKNAK